MPKLRFVFLLACALPACLLQAQHIDSLPPLPVSVDATRFTVSGASIGGDVLLVGYSREETFTKSTLHRHRFIRVADANGAASLTPDGGVPRTSIWVAVDLRSGRYGAVSPGADSPRQAAIAADALRKDNNGQLKKLVARLPLAYFLLVRPSEGVWELTAGDGGRGDDDRQLDGATTTSLDDFTPVRGNGAPPKKFAKGDLLIVFSPLDTAIFVTRVKE